MTGWDQGCLTMKLGEIAKLTIPGKLGYGAGGFTAWGYPLLTVQYIQDFEGVFACVVWMCVCVRVIVHP